MKFFLDSANLEEIKEVATLGLLDGVTTNPSLVAKEKKQDDFKKTIKEICKIAKGPVSAEVISTNFEDMKKEGLELSKIDKNVVVKLPMTLDGIKATKFLSNKKIPVNVTLIFSASQALIAAKAGAAYVSPFVGRLDDISTNGMSLINEISEIFMNYGFPTEILVASIRNPIHIVDSARMGADVATLPYKVLMQLLDHPLTDIGLNKFLSDWKKK
ncbi:fructose-6-phosphate aldolase [bacterium]|jgi:transaldolase|nr:fructose-6-phosphate aldolase [bacterium]MBT3849684.1 fructose-6-phosphate aldolase [bacterium]MDG2445402.1 fructose-6-phosphate aldolase [Thermodesulfobacteriota bacterium]NSX00144.1 fructose-6-phosphate aldolase [bacterium]|tara:strand:+ start:4160 stop:4804 length:645 start_codon:yes stop_codon:yes gene_type:complete